MEDRPAERAADRPFKGGTGLPRAKDIGSAAVALSLISVAVVWLLVIIDKL